jgi:hypothetical protein
MISRKELKLVVSSVLIASAVSSTIMAYQFTRHLRAFFTCEESTEFIYGVYALIADHWKKNLGKTKGSETALRFSVQTN